MGKPVALVLGLLASCYLCQGLKILTIFPLISKSHNILGDGINRHLLNAGHEVTYITAFVKNNTHPKLRQIDVTKNFEMVPEDRLHMKSFQSSSSSMSMGHFVMMIGLHVMTRWTIENENVQKLLHDPKEHFDVVISDWAINEITYTGIAKIYDVPLIWASTLEPHWMLMKYIDEALHPAYTSDIMSPKIPPFSFWQRAEELWTQIKVTFYKEIIFHYFDSSLYYEHLAPIIEARGRTPPKAQDLRYNASLVIGNSHVSFGEAHRLPVNYVAVGGYHIDDNVKPLQGEMKKLMDDSKQGVIYFSMGSLIKSKDFPDEVKVALITMFGKLNYTVIWKFEEDRENLPANLHLVKWAPQQSILAHPNCVLFITHGGLLSTTESIHHGIPVVGIPVFVDQFDNIHRAVAKGFAKKVELTMNPTLADDLQAAIEEVLGDPKYKQKVEQLSFIFHHRPVKPGDELVHWVEHVVKTQGAPHMRSPALLVPLYQKMYLDLLAVIVLIIVIVRFLYKNVLRDVLFKKSNKMKTN